MAAVAAARARCSMLRLFAFMRPFAHDMFHESALQKSPYITLYFEAGQAEVLLKEPACHLRREYRRDASRA